ncbi:MAG: hypothetical protein HY982_02380 [Candidatus Magasanikbacteria bacterium]|nr:hypothetical protein [Candidatus Magasanikbacteria bacterium]
MIKYLFYFLVFLLVASGVKAQVPGTPAGEPKGEARENLRDVRQNVRKEVREARQDTRKEIRDTRQDTRKEVRDIRQDTRKELKQQFEAKRMEFKNQVEAKREEFKKKVEEKRAVAKEKIEAKRAELKERLVKIKDERKKQAALRIDARLDELNKRQTDHFMATLEKLEKVLENIESRASKAEANGRDVSSVRSRISEAQQAIAGSRSAIQTQAGKTYELAINEESTLRIDVGKARQALHSDLVKTRETVRVAHEAVRKAAVSLAQIPKVDSLDIETTPADISTPTSGQNQ